MFCAFNVFATIQLEPKQQISYLQQQNYITLQVIKICSLAILK